MVDDIGFPTNRSSAVTNHPTNDLGHVSADECSDEYKVLARVSKHLSVSEAGGGKIPEGVLFYKELQIVAPVTVNLVLV